MDEHGEPLYAQGASNNGKRYRYFVSRGLISGAANGRRGWRVPAPELEQAVLAVLRSILVDQAGLVAAIEDSAEVEQVLATVANWRKRLDSEYKAGPPGGIDQAGAIHRSRTQGYCKYSTDLGRDWDRNRDFAVAFRPDGDEATRG